MQRFKPFARLLSAMILVLSLYCLTACHPQPPIILQSSATQKIPRNVSVISEHSDGWFISDDSLARLLECCERCQTKK